MDDFAGEYQHRSDEELLQLWVERSQLVEEARHALKNEIHKRALFTKAECATDVWAEPRQRELAHPVSEAVGPCPVLGMWKSLVGFDFH
jgi:uncharacterized protein YaeQ